MYYFISLIVLILGIIIALTRKPLKQKILFATLSIIISLLIIFTGTFINNRKAEQRELQITQTKNNYNARAKLKFKELMSSGQYPLAIKQKVNFDKEGKITNIQLWCDESLATKKRMTISYYYSMGTLIGSYALNHTDHTFPNVEVFAGSHMITKSDKDNPDLNVYLKK